MYFYISLGPNMEPKESPMRGQMEVKPQTFQWIFQAYAQDPSKGGFWKGFGKEIGSHFRILGATMDPN